MTEEKAADVIDIWSFRIKKSAQAIEDEKKKREELNNKQNTTSKITKALEKWGSWRGKKK